MQNNFNERRILFCLHCSELNNGAVRSLIDVIEYLIKNYNVKAYVIYLDNRGSAIDYLEKLGVDCFYIPFYRIDYYKNIKVKQKIKNYINYSLKRMISPLCFHKAKEIISKYKITIIYTNTIVIDYGFKLGLKMGLSHIWHIREFGKEDHGLSLRNGEVALYEKMRKSKAIIYISKAIEKKYRLHMKNEVSQYVIYNDISTDFINSKKAFNMDVTKPLHAAIIGTIQEGKGQLEAIKAVELVNKNKQPKVVLHIAGKKEGKYFEQLERYVNNHELNKFIIFDGFIKDVNGYRSNMDIGIVASSNEAFGRVTIEGMLSELAIVGADAAGTLELIQNKRNGMLYHKGNEKELAGILKIFYDDRNYMKKIAKTGFQGAIENYTTHHAAKKIISILQEI